MTQRYAVIGDLIGSRRFEDRGGAQRDLEQALDDVNLIVTPVQHLETTVGDEFQGLYATVADATAAALMVRLSLLPRLDVRCGIGAGEVTVIDGRRRPLIQDGTAWWAARDALVELGKPRRRAARTWYVGTDAPRVTAFLLLRDSSVDRLNDRGRRILRAALTGMSQEEIAAVEQVSPSAVSQQFARGVGAVREAQELMGRSEQPAGPDLGA